MSLCELCLCHIDATDGGICETCYRDWLDYQASKRDDEGDDDA